MRSKYRALLWEQLRTAGVITAWCFCVAQGVHSCGYVMSDPEIWPRADLPGLSLNIAVVTLAAAAIFLGVRYAGAGRLAFGIEPRLYRQPVPTVALVVLPLAVQLAAMAVLFGAFSTVQRVFYGQGFSWSWCIVLAEFYLVVQLFLHLLRAMPLLAVACGLLAVSLPPIFRSESFPLSDYTLRLIVEDLTRPLRAIFVVSLSVAVLHVLTRWERTHSAPEPGEYVVRAARFLARFTARKRPFRSPLEAQMWYERRRTLWMFPAFTLAAVAIFCTLSFPRIRTSWETHEELFDACLSAVVAAAALTAIVLAVLDRRWRSGRVRFENLRPMTAEVAASARVLTQLQAAMLAALAVAVIVLLPVFFGNGIEATATRAAFRNGQVGLIEAVALLAGPFLLLLIIAWGLLWSLSRAYLTLAIAFFVTRTVSLNLLHHYDVIPKIPGFLADLYRRYYLFEPPYPQTHEPAQAIYHPLPCQFCDLTKMVPKLTDSIIEWFCLFVLPVLVVLYLLYRARRQRLITWRGTGLLIVLWAVLAWLFTFATGVDATRAPLALVSAYAAAFALIPYVGELLHVRSVTNRPAALHGMFRAVIHLPFVRIAAITVVTACVVLGLLDRIEPTFVRKLRGMGYPTSYEELYAIQAPLPDSENAAIPLMRAMNCLVERRDLPKPVAYLLGEDDYKRLAPPSIFVQPEIGYFLARNECALALLSTIQHYRKCQFPLGKIEDDYRLVPETDAMIVYHHLLPLMYWKSAFSIAANDSEGFMNTLRVYWTLENLRHPGDDGVNSAYQWHRTIAFQTHTALNAIRFGSGDIEEMSRLTESYQPPDSMEVVNGMSIAFVYSLGAGLPFYNWQPPVKTEKLYEPDDRYLQLHGTTDKYRLGSLMEKWRESDLLDQFRGYLYTFELIEARTISVGAAIAYVKSANAEYQRFFQEPRFRGPSLPTRTDSGSWKYELDSIVSISVVEAALAIELFERAHDRLPATLEELVPEYLPEVPKSLFTAQPLSYERLPNGYFVYAADSGEPFGSPDVSDEMKQSRIDFLVNSGRAIRVSRADLAAHAEEGVH